MQWAHLFSRLPGAELVREAAPFHQVLLLIDNVHLGVQKKKKKKKEKEKKKKEKIEDDKEMKTIFLRRKKMRNERNFIKSDTGIEPPPPLPKNHKKIIEMRRDLIGGVLP